jgi:hypothetical protein
MRGPNDWRSGSPPDTIKEEYQLELTQLNGHTEQVKKALQALNSVVGLEELLALERRRMR